MLFEIRFWMFRFYGNKHVPPMEKGNGPLPNDLRGGDILYQAAARAVSLEAIKQLIYH